MQAGDPARRSRWPRALVVLGVALSLVALVAVLPALGAVVADAVAERFATDLPEAPMPPEARAALLELARDRSAVHGAPSAEIRPAHDSASVDELRDAVRGDFQSIEGDVGLVRDTAVLRHDVREPVGMTLDEWVEVVATAGFAVVKVDVKRDKVGALTAQLQVASERHGLREEQLKLNVDVLEGPGAYEGFSWQERAYTRLVLKLELADAEELARAFPRAAISIGAWVGEVPAGVRYSETDIDRFRAAVATVRRAGGERVVVAARWDLLTPEFVEALAAAGATIDLWNAPQLAAPDDAAAEVRRLREQFGAAIGVIDLRR